MKVPVALMCLVMALSPVPVPAEGIGEAEPAWTLAKEADGIRVYTRPISGSDFHAFRGVAELPAGSDRIRVLFDDVGTWPEWMYRSSEAKVLASTGASERYTYSINGFPWPARDRVFLVRSREAHDPVTDTTTVTLQSVDEAELPPGARARMPERGNLVPVDAMSGSWQFRALDTGHTEAVYELHVEPGGRLPAGLVNRLIVDTPFETLRAMRERLQQDADD